jgi:hypothetical protein
LIDSQLRYNAFVKYNHQRYKRIKLPKVSYYLKYTNKLMLNSYNNI